MGSTAWSPSRLELRRRSPGPVSPSALIAVASVLKLDVRAPGTATGPEFDEDEQAIPDSPTPEIEAVASAAPGLDSLAYASTVVDAFARALPAQDLIGRTIRATLTLEGKTPTTRWRIEKLTP